MTTELLTDELRAELIRAIDERDQLRSELQAYEYAIEKIKEALAKYRRDRRYAYTLNSIATWADMPPIEIAAEKERQRLKSISQT